MKYAYHIVGNLSGGVCSWAANKLAAAEIPPKELAERLTLLFADTLIECDDLYRFLIESAANIFGIPTPALKWLKGIPPLRDMDARKAHLADLRKAATEAIPGLAWVADGRHPWEVYRDEKFIGNSLVDPCSKFLKRITLDRWMNENFGKARPTTRGVVGLGQWERERFEGQYVTKKDKTTGHERKEWKAGLAERMAAKGWAFRAPLIYYKPTFDRNGIYRWLDREDIAPPALSEEGFDTNNCGGFCCKMGHKQAHRLYWRRREIYEWHAEQERMSQDVIGTDCTALSRTVAGKKTPLPLVELAGELAAQEACSLFPSQPACGCFTGDEEEAA